MKQPVFNEQSLLAAVCEEWGAYGAHAEVLNDLIRRADAPLVHPAADDSLSAQARPISQERGGIAGGVLSESPSFDLDTLQGWRALYEAREQEAHELSEQIIRLSNVNADLRQAARVALALAQVKWGYLDKDANAEFDKCRAAIDRATS